MKEVKEYVDQIPNQKTLEDQLTTKTRGATPLHKAAEFCVLDYLLQKVGSAANVVNCLSKGGYTPLYFAARNVHEEGSPQTQRRYQHQRRIRKIAEAHRRVEFEEQGCTYFAQ